MITFLFFFLTKMNEVQMNEDQMNEVPRRGYYATSTSTAYGHQKTGSQGSLTTALLLTNTTVMITLFKKHGCLNDATCISGLFLACLSIVLQISIGILLITLARNEHIHHAKKDRTNREDNKLLRKNDDNEQRKKNAKRVNTIILVLSFLVVVSNIALNGIYNS